MIVAIKEEESDVNDIEVMSEWTGGPVGGLV